MDLQSVLKTYKDFPKQGITFFDIIPYLQDKEIYRTLIDRIAECTTAPNVAAPEARGFLRPAADRKPVRTQHHTGAQKR